MSQKRFVSDAAKSIATQPYLRAAFALGCALALSIALPAFDAKASQKGEAGAAGSKHSSAQEKGHIDGTEHSGQPNSGGKSGRKGGAGDYARGGTRAGVKGHIFDQQEEGHDQGEANKGPHPGGNPAEKERRDGGGQ